MPCKWVQLPNGGHALVKTESIRPRACSVCKRKTPKYKLCDFAVKPGKTCDAVLCQACAAHREPDTDYCPLHATYLAGKLKL